MSRVLVWSLPRMGSTSVAEALRLLGYPTVHFCPLTNTKYADHLSLIPEGKTSIVSTGKELGQFLANCVRTGQKIEGKVLILTRDMVEWDYSIAAWGRIRRDFAPELANYREILDKMPANFFKFDVKQGWRGLCPILEESIPKVDFPKTNVGPPTWEI